jgi:hypothetical protein
MFSDWQLVQLSKNHSRRVKETQVLLTTTDGVFEPAYMIKSRVGKGAAETGSS